MSVLSQAQQNAIGQQLENQATIRNAQQGIVGHTDPGSYDGSAGSFVGNGPKEPNLWQDTVSFVATFNALFLWAGILAIGLYIFIRRRSNPTR